MDVWRFQNLSGNKCKKINEWMSELINQCGGKLQGIHQPTPAHHPLRSAHSYRSSCGANAATVKRELWQSLWKRLWRSNQFQSDMRKQKRWQDKQTNEEYAHTAGLEVTLLQPLLHVVWHSKISRCLISAGCTPFNSLFVFFYSLPRYCRTVRFSHRCIPTVLCCVLCCALTYHCIV